VVVGEGREKFGHVFMAETGTSVGEISGHSKTINSCDFRPGRPMKIVTGGEDNLIGYFEGPPFKFKGQIEDHSKYVQAVRYSPKGDLFASAGFDGRIFVYNGTTFERVAELTGDGPNGAAHGGGCYAISWSPDGSRLMSASGDRTCKVYDVETKQSTSVFKVGADVLDQQVSCLWQGPHLLSVSLSGFINYWNESSPDKAVRVITGHNKSITAISVQGTNLYTGGYDGFVNYWDLKTHSNQRLVGGHKNQVQDMVLVPSKSLIFTIGLDDRLRSIDSRSNQYTPLEAKLDSQPRALAVLGELLVIACYRHLLVYDQQGNHLSSLPITYEATCCAASEQQRHVAVGSNQNRVYIYRVSACGTQIEQLQDRQLDHRGSITCAEYSADGQMLVVGDANRKVIAYDNSYKQANDQEMGFHTARVNCVSWNGNSNKQFVSGSLDTSLIVWDVADVNKALHQKKAHPLSQVNKVKWVDDHTFVSVGQDANVKIWDVVV
jgi:WD40 repeat protein